MSFLDKLWEKGLTAFGDIMVQTSPPKVRACHCREAMAKVIPGAVICRKFNCYLDHFLIPGAFSHSGIVESPNYVIHSIAEGVERIDLLDFIKDSDGFIILFPKEPAIYSHAKAINYARENIGKPYDFKFQADPSLKVSAFFCHELTAKCLEAGGIKIAPQLKHIGIELHEIYLADQFIDDVRMRTIYEACVG